MAALTLYITWVEVLVGCAALTAIMWHQLKKTKQQLFKNGSIVQYWREELGGRPDADDPYDLQFPVDCFLRRAAASNTLSKIAEGSPDAASAWRKHQAPPVQPGRRPINRQIRKSNRQSQKYVAAIF